MSLPAEGTGDTQADGARTLVIARPALSRIAVDRESPRVDVIGIGVQKAATSWLWKCLGEHPEVRISRGRPADRKELNFFNHRWERGFGWYEEMFDAGPWRNMEFSTLYFHDASVPERVYSYNPEARLLLALRNPVDRAYSHHRHEYRRGRIPEKRRDFWESAARNPSYLEIGSYATHLERWLRWFPSERIHVIFYEEICSVPERVLRQTFEFLSLDPNFRPPSTRRKVNEAVRLRVPELNRVLRTASRGLQKRLGAKAHRLLKATGIPRTLRRRNRVRVKPTELPALSTADRERLAAAFQVENQRLGQLLGRDLSHWLP